MPVTIRGKIKRDFQTSLNGSLTLDINGDNFTEIFTLRTSDFELLFSRLTRTITISYGKSKSWSENLKYFVDKAYE